MLRFGIVFWLILGTGIVCNSQTTSEADQEILNRVVSVTATDLGFASFIREFGRRQKIKIGCYCSLPQERRVTVKMNKGTVRQVLQDLVASNPEFTWSIVEGVINIYPKQRPKLLDLKISMTDLRQLSFDDAALAVLDLSEVAEYLRQNDLRAAKVIIAIGGGDTDSTVTLKLQNTTFGETLNEVLRNSQARFWVFDSADSTNRVVRVLFQ